MPVRSLHSAVLKWPDQDAVLAAARAWACALQAQDASVREVWCVGSYARGDWGVGSDVDLVVVLHDTFLSPAERYHRYYPDPLPVHAASGSIPWPSWINSANIHPISGDA